MKELIKNVIVGMVGQALIISSITVLCHGGSLLAVALLWTAGWLIYSLISKES